MFLKNYFASLEEDRKLECFESFVAADDSFSLMLNKLEAVALVDGTRLSAPLEGLLFDFVIRLVLVSEELSTLACVSSLSLTPPLPLALFRKLYFLSELERVSRDLVGAVESDDSFASDEPCSKLSRVFRVERLNVEEAILQTELVGES
jgi:hypothetical protein